MNNETIGERIAKKRKEAGLTQNKLAEMLIISNKAVSKWESGLSSPSIDLLPNLADILHCSIDYLIRGTSDVEPKLVNNQFDSSSDISLEDMKKLKEQVLDSMVNKISSVAFDVWIEELVFYKLKNNILYLITDSSSAKNVITRKYLELILSAVNEIYPAIEKICIEVRQTKDED